MTLTDKRAAAIWEAQGQAAQTGQPMSVYELIHAERQRQDRLHPATVMSAYHWLSVLGEEVGEAHRAANERDLVALREELVHVAAVAVHIVELMDAGRLAEQEARAAIDAHMTGEWLDRYAAPPAAPDPLCVCGHAESKHPATNYKQGCLLVGCWCREFVAAPAVAATEQSRGEGT